MPTEAERLSFIIMDQDCEDDFAQVLQSIATYAAHVLEQPPGSDEQKAACHVWPGMVHQSLTNLLQRLRKRPRLAPRHRRAMDMLFRRLEPLDGEMKRLSDILPHRSFTDPQTIRFTNEMQSIVDEMRSIL